MMKRSDPTASSPALSGGEGALTTFIMLPAFIIRPLLPSSPKKRKF